eukprot:COSAG05_NODE_649_length_8102_cov_157.470823_13_plen_243_part_00
MEENDALLRMRGLQIAALARRDSPAVARCSEMAHLSAALTAVRLLTASSGTPPMCLDVHVAAQEVRIEAWGENAVRVRAVPSGKTIRDDLVSALVPPPPGLDTGSSACASTALGASGQSVTSGNIMASLGADGRLSFTRLSDSKLLLQEAAPRELAPTTTTPPLPGFLSLGVSFAAAPGERVYGLGQHKTGQLDNMGGHFDLAPHNTEILIPVVPISSAAVLRRLPATRCDFPYKVRARLRG